MPIPRYPTIPTQLIAAAAAGRIVPFVGSGVSKNCGSPTWGEFASGAVEQAMRLNLVSEVESHVLMDMAKKAPRTALSIVSQREDSRKTWLNYSLILHPQGMSYTPHGRRIFSAIGRMASTLITTNYDRWLDNQLFETRDNEQMMPENFRKIVFERDVFSPEQLLERNTVIHLHGRCTSKESMVISTSHYLQHYRASGNKTDDENRVLTLLRALFRDSCVLFLGYGLSEMEILEYVVQKGVLRVDEGAAPRHFVLFPFTEDEDIKAKLMAEYFRAFGIGLLPFPWDGDPSQFATLLERIADALPRRDPVEAEIEYQLQQLGEGF